ncbi:MAG: transcriptional coactivator p15/PC4 family protein [Acidobacteriota bacterium]|nr:transcriptional coactivator p15/PC4 family protein [Acidobacteriota bacterium]
MDARDLIGSVEKNSAEIVRVGISRFKGNTYVDIRLWLLNEGGKDPVPTKKGLCLRPEIIEELLPMLEKAVVKAQRIEPSAHEERSML